MNSKVSFKPAVLVNLKQFKIRFAGDERNQILNWVNKLFKKIISESLFWKFDRKILGEIFQLELLKTRFRETNLRFLLSLEPASFRPRRLKSVWNAGAKAEAAAGCARALKDLCLELRNRAEN